MYLPERIGIPYRCLIVTIDVLVGIFKSGGLIVSVNSICGYPHRWDPCFFIPQKWKKKR